ncbi:family S53 protease [Trametes versicolor FP-101664 SS1]|uniref:family S53 protease n=1 Tax=Trametes versicolor (strain FP-101664) TaxID=717944 RepID=UPI00046212BC|nr:family S53 protease [Trametes versicolor FP-101664 SS1]EIW56150.1 family S53 protease [Trametes versicolor FP-101664 SS1]
MKLSPAFLIASLVGSAYGTPTARSLVVHETRESVPASFKEVGPAPPDTVLNLRLALVQGNFSALEKALMDVSTPDSPLYGQHLSKEEVAALVAPKPETVAAVNTWLSENGIQASKASFAGDWLKFSIPVSKANALLGTTFSVFNHTASGRTSIRTLNYSIPADLKGHIDLIHPTIAFTQSIGAPKLAFTPRKDVQARALNVTSDAVPASCATTTTPTCLQALYGIPTTPGPVKTNNTCCVSGYIEQWANEQDLRTFLTNLSPDINPATTFDLFTINGGTNPQGLSQAGIEADLDIQYTVGLAPGVTVLFVSVGPDNADGDDAGFLDTIISALGCQTPPTVLSTSYGGNEDELPVNLYQNLCNAYAQLGARGTSILFSSGDGGVSGNQAEQCTTFVPTFPSGCPFVTSVGATTGIGPEVAASFSSGGFSNVFPTPSYQAAAVSQYLNGLGNTNAGRFNPSGRGFPDIAAQGANIEIVFQEQFGTVDGTSASTPIVASIIALLNDLLAAQGRPPLGFLNPFLYSVQGAAAFTDVTIGSNPGCNTNGFPARPGWDPVTGLGTPNFAKLRSVIGV